jgi:phage tail protein X
MDSFNYQTKEGDRIDLLAHRFYGGDFGISVLSDANPSVPLYPVYPLGTILIVPIIDNMPETANQN